MTTTFQQSAFPSLYWSGSSIGYLLPRGDSAGTTLDLTASWTAHSGCYVFVSTAVPADAPSQQHFAEAFWQLIGGAGMNGTRFAWITDPNDPSGRLSGPTIAVTGPPGSGGAATVRRLASLDLRNVAVAVTPGCSIAPSSDGTAFLIGPGSAADPALYVTVQEGAETLNIVDKDAGVTVPLTGTSSGCLQLRLKLTESGSVPDLDLLDVGLRMFVPETLPGAAATDPVFLGSLRYPVFADTVLEFDATLDPLNPLKSARSWLSFTTIDPIRSHYLTNLGARLTLAPAEGTQLVFAEKPADTSGAPGSPLYLVPSGSFSVGVDGAGAAAGESLMCGISGVEYLKLPGGSQPVLDFVPGGHAYAETGGGLQSVATTAYAYTSGELCAQPDSSVLHSPPQQGDWLYGIKNPLAALSYLEVVSSTLPATPPVKWPQAFPLLPFDGVATADAAAEQALEAAAIAPARRALIAQIAAAAIDASEAMGEANGTGNGGTSIIGTTPQGLLAQFAPGMETIQTLTLALNEDGTSLPLQGIANPSPLWTALQANQLFLVVSEPSSIQAAFEQAASQLHPDGWTFDFWPETWRPLGGPHPTFLVFKFAGKSLGDLANDLSSWGQAAAFNETPQIAAQALDDYVKDTRERRHTNQDPDLAWFVDTVLDDPNWNGIVALNCHTPVDQWPPQLRGLAAGIDPSKLFAHHAGVQITPVKTTTDGSGNQQLTQRPSSIFGLIDYEDPHLLPASPNPYDFKVLQLKVRLANSRVVSFASQITLQVNQLFGEPCELQGGTDNNLLFNGVYQSANGHDTYTFTHAARSTFLMTSSVIAAIGLTRAEFVTVTDPNTRPSKPTFLELQVGSELPPPVQTQFLIWGVLDLKALAAFDVFSFGTETGQDLGSAGLTFANLAVGMTVTETDPKLEATRTFTFDASRISFDLAQSYPRQSSLYSAFPLTLTGLVQADAKTSPTTLNYAPASTPLEPGLLGTPWFGMTFQLQLGTLGAWAPSGAYNAGLLAAWSPDATKPNVFVGLQLPGMAGGQPQIPLEGPLKLTMKAIAFEGPRTKGGTDYTLWFQSLALGFFGLAFPFTGRTDVLLFAKAAGGKRTLGWYAVYDKDASGSGSQPTGSSTLRDSALPLPLPPGAR